MLKFVYILVAFLNFKNLYSISDINSNNQCPANEIDLREHLLCRQCGREVTELDSIINSIFSPLAIRNTSSTSLSSRPVVTQSVVNPAGVKFQIITTKKADCIPFGVWQEASTWFPGYSWKACVCGQCHSHVGWAFTDSTDGGLINFYALIEDNLLSEQFVQSLVIYPKA